MKKNIQFLFFILLLNGSYLLAGRGGSSFAGGMVGGMMGSVISGAMTKSSDKGAARRAEERARVAEEKAESVRRDQDRDRMESLRREMVEKTSHRDQKTTNFMMNALLFAVILLFLIVIGLGVLFLKKKKE